MADAILVFSHGGDPHGTAVLAEIERAGQPAFMFDLADLPHRAAISIDYDEPTDPAILVDHVTSGSLDASQVRSVWWRRPRAPSLDAITDPDAFGFAHGEWHEALNGMYQLLTCPWMNDPIRNEIASRKALQLSVAAELGMRIPRTLMTSSPDRARGFIEELGFGNVVFKTFAATHQVWRETRLVRREDLAVLDSVRQAPVIFQEYIPAAADVRVTIVGGEVFAMAIDTRGTSYEVDFRVSMKDAATTRIDVPDELTKRLLALMDRFGLVYGAIDLRHTADDDYVFLEINPAGEFLFVEHRTGLPVTASVSNWLLDPR